MAGGCTRRCSWFGSLFAKHSSSVASRTAACFCLLVLSAGKESANSTQLDCTVRASAVTVGPVCVINSYAMQHCVLNARVQGKPREDRQGQFYSPSSLLLLLRERSAVSLPLSGELVMLSKSLR